MSSPAQFQQEIEWLLDQIAKAPTQLSFYHQLRDASLKHKAAGGRDRGEFAKLKLKCQSADPLQRRLEALRLWSFDPGNTNHVVSVIQSLENYSHEFPSTNVAPLRHWLIEILTRMNGDSRS